MDIDTIITHAKAFLLKHGKHPPVMYVEVEGKADPIMLPFYNFPFTSTRERERGLFTAARFFAQSNKKRLKRTKVTALAFVVEAWGRKQKPGDSYIQPSRAPDRIEILAVTWLDVPSMTLTASMFEMLRSGTSLDLVAIEQPQEARGSLLPAFLVGIETASRPEGDALAKLRQVCDEYAAGSDEP